MRTRLCISLHPGSIEIYRRQQGKDIFDMIFQDACWGIDIGKNSIKAVRIRHDKSRVEIKAVDRVEYTGSKEGLPSAEEINRAFNTFISRNSIRSTDSVAVALPGHMALIRFINVPQLATADLSESIIGEAQQKIPFPLDEVQWGFQKIDKPYKPGEEIEVGLFAIKKEIIENYLADFDESGIEVDILTIAPLALFNFVKYEMSLPDNVVVVDIGADHTDLVIVEGNKFYVREIALGGNDVSKTLQETFSISFDEADALKCKAAQSSQASKIFSIMQPVLHDFVSEIQRSLGFYKSQSPGVQFPIIVLLGNGMKVAGLAKYFGQNLGMKVHYLSDIERLELDRDVNIDMLQSHLPTYGIAMGLALQGIGATENAINLIPDERKGQKEMARKLPLLLVSALLLFLLIVFMYWDKSRHMGEVNALIATATNEIKRIEEVDEKAAGVLGISQNLLHATLKDPNFNRRDRRAPKSNTIRGLKMECELLASICHGRSMSLERLNSLMGVLGTEYPVKDGITPCTAVKNTEIHPDLEGMRYEELMQMGIKRSDAKRMMEASAKKKLWLLEYSCSVKRKKDGSEKLVHNIIGATATQANSKESYDKLEFGFVQTLRKAFNIPADGENFKLHKNDPINTEYMRADAPESPNSEKFYKFELEWSEGLRKARPANLPKRPKK